MCRAGVVENRVFAATTNTDQSIERRGKVAFLVLKNRKNGNKVRRTEASGVHMIDHRKGGPDGVSLNDEQTSHVSRSAVLRLGIS